MKRLKKIFAICSFLPLVAGASDFVVGTASIIDLRNESGTSQWNISDDGRSSAISLGFTFEFYGNDYTQGYMSTNGCFSFTTAYCNDYTPDPLPDTVYTIYPFWTDLIRDSGSKMLTKYFAVPGGDDYFVAGWYDLREYHRASDNTFEMLLYENGNNIEFRYEDLDIIQHDVLIGIQGDSTEYKQYLFHDECSTGSTNVSGSCVNTDWNNTSFNTTLENESLFVEIDITSQCGASALYSENCSGYAVAYFNQQCGINAFYDEECSGYAAAYLLQQCGLSSLYSINCSGYEAAYLLQQCDLDDLYDSSCAGYGSALARQQAIEDSYQVVVVEEEELFDDGTYEQDDYAMLGISTDDIYMNVGFTSEEDFYGYEEEEYTYEEQYEPEYFEEEIFFEPEIWEEEVFDFQYVNDPQEDLYLMETDMIYEEEFSLFLPQETYEEFDYTDFQPSTMEEEFFSQEEFEEELIPVFAEEMEIEGEFLLAQLDEEYILEDMEITDTWLDVEEDVLEEELVEEERNLLEEQSEEIFEELIEDEALEELIDERQLEELTLVEEEEELDEKEVEERELVAEEEEEEEEKEEEETEKRSERKNIRRTRAVSIAMNSVRAVSSQQSGQSSSGGSSSQQQSGTTMMSSSGTTVSSSGASMVQNSDPVSQSEQSLATGDTFVQEQQEQTSGVQQIQMTETPATQIVADSPFEMAEQQQQAQQQLQQDFVLEGGETFTQADIQFEDSFSEAMAVGGDIGTFLSQQAPDFGRFEIEPPTVSEERIASAVESLAERVGAEVAQQNLQQQLDTMMEEGGFDSDQTAAVTFLGFKEGFSQYTNQSQIQDNADWYLDRSIYENVELDDNVFNFYMMAGKTQLKLNEMIQSQYNR